MIADFLLPNDFTMTDAFSRLDSHDSHSRRERTATDVSVSSDSTLVDDNDVSSLPCHRAMKGQLTPPLTPASGDLVKPAPQQPAPSTVIHPDTPDDIAEDACLELNERKARSAVRYAIRNCAQLDAYRVRSVVGFGSNGVVLAARHNHQDVAVKIIYKASAAENPASCIAPTAEPTLPNEIAILEVLAKEAPHPNVLAYHTHWDDALHYYLSPPSRFAS
ncbi:hypothetical protein HK101_009217 [Irineochytrium annulatum]|nr:hypothetical protein HK101_009217 [Irineochytrium annulatum]